MTKFGKASFSVLIKVLQLLRVRHELTEAVGTVETAVPAQRDASAKTNPCGGKPSLGRLWTVRPSGDNPER